MCVVVVVDDEEMIRMIAAELLQDAGHDVVEFDNAADAMEFCRDPANDFGAVFTDINMPGDLDGLDVAQFVTTIRPNAAVIVTSGRYHAPPADMPPQARFLPKPWTPAALLDAIGAMAA